MRGSEACHRSSRATSSAYGAGSGIHSTVSAPDRGGDDDQGDEPIYFFEFVRVNEP
ncbi:hypothetical protein FHS26_003777 [Rhizobium pisi]|uniref:Uncharacterized protein n=1 Tax=Rhizobium pisi TaxID=574561 RepID=A0A7W5BN37_9HYPH|nr:hypothetical protein [Rhizobium pisi]MBB3136030.1 hypothetical protein [Rhizobium pisi]